MLQSIVEDGGRAQDRRLQLCRGPVKPLPRHDVVSLFMEQARRTPAAAALAFAEQVLSYAELAREVDQLAALLVEREVRPGDRVAIRASRSLEMVVGLLAVLRAGAAYVPLDPEAPGARTLSILRESAPRLVLAHSPEGLAGFTVLSFAEVAASVAVHAAIDGDALAYVIYTSGSTGVPKGVEVRHISLANHALEMAELYQLRAGDRVLCSASIGFDVAAEQIFPALICGATVVVRPEDLFRSLDNFDRYLRAAEISTLILPTAFFHEWTRELGAGALRLPPGLRAVGVGTEQVAAAQLETFLAGAGGRVRFLQGYGPTEATVTCTAYVHAGEPLGHGAPVPIGRPLANTEAYVLDPAGALTADDQVGELYIGGIGLARGYLGRDDLTRERFVPHPFSQQPGARLYRTGDLVKRAADGQLIFVGREDFQFKVRGHRVEPREIEDVLCEQPGIAEAVVVLRGQQLVGYVVAERLDADELTRACRARLPSYMVPGVFVALPAFPKTLNQKIDRNALPEPKSRPRSVKTAARNDMELLVARAFAEALGITTPVAPDDDFFELGGDSLRALRLLQLIRQGCSGELALADVFAAPTVAALAGRVGSVDRPSVLCLKPGRGTPLFLVCGIQIYQALAHALTCENPVYALLLPSEGLVANGSSELPAVEQFASEYLRILSAHTPEGPCALGGLSFGGAVAYEMARQLAETGREVSLLVLFDTVLPRAHIRGLRPRILHRLRAIRRAPPARARAMIIERLRRLLPRAAPVAARGDALEQLDAQRESTYSARIVDYDRTSKPYGGRVVLYRAEDAEGGPFLPGHGFELLVDDLTREDIPGDHLGILREPGVGAIARSLEWLLTAPR
jgi:amino acid adenylation domain-containing protein